MPLLLNVDVTDRLVVVVGCGPAGLEKVERLIAAAERLIEGHPSDVGQLSGPAQHDEP